MDVWAVCLCAFYKFEGSDSVVVYCELVKFKKNEASMASEVVNTTLSRTG